MTMEAGVVHYVERFAAYDGGIHRAAIFIHYKTSE
jgi:hypothetical protein